MIALVAPRMRAGWLTALLALVASVFQGSCCTCPDERQSTTPLAAKPEDNAPPIVRGRARWFVEPTTTSPGLVGFDVWAQDPSSPAKNKQLEVYWVVAGSTTYPPDPQLIFTRLVTLETPLDWYQYDNFAHEANITTIGTPPVSAIQIEVIVTTRANNKFTFEMSLPIDKSWYAFSQVN